MKTVASSSSSVRDGEDTGATAPSPADDTLLRQSLALMGVFWSGPKRGQLALLVVSWSR